MIGGKEPHAAPQRVTLQAALSLHKVGRREDAKRAYEELLRKNAGNYDALHLLGVLHFELGDAHRAEALIAKAISLKRNQAEFHCNYGLVLRSLGQGKDALTHFDLAVRLNKRYPAAYINRGVALQDLGRYEEALADFEESLKLERSAVGLLNRGLALRDLRRFTAAVESLEQAVKTEPENIDAQINLGGGYAYFGRLESALALFNNVLRSNPKCIPALNNRGAVLRDLGRYDAAFESFRYALKIDPYNVEVLANRGALLNDVGRYAEAHVDLDQVLTVRPDHVGANWAKSIGYLCEGRFSDGWALYDYRIRNTKLSIDRPRTQKPVWNPMFTDKKLLICDEQGLGDTIFFSSQLSKAKFLGKCVTVRVDERLIPLFNRSFPEVKFVPNTTDLSEIDFDSHMLLGSIYHSLLSLGSGNASLEDPVQRKEPYLRASQDRVTQFKQTLTIPGKRVVGISWKSFRTGIGQDKSVTLDLLQPILEIENFVFVNLQYGDVSTEIESFYKRTGINIVQLRGLNLTRDLDSVAALVAACDGVLSVSNTVSHLAGALGVPGVVLLPSGKGKLFYWNNKIGSRSYWYPTLELFSRGNHPDTDLVAEVGRHIQSRFSIGT